MLVYTVKLPFFLDKNIQNSKNILSEFWIWDICTEEKVIYLYMSTLINEHVPRPSIKQCV